MFKNILVPIDGSEPSKRALEAAISLCEGNESKCLITLHHVIPSLNHLKKHTDIDLKHIESKLRNEAFDKFDSWNVKVLNHWIKCDFFIEMGDPAETICNRAKSNHHDLIVIGCRGIGLVNEFILGSVSHKVTKTAPCPVLTTR